MYIINRKFEFFFYKYLIYFHIAVCHLCLSPHVKYIFQHHLMKINPVFIEKNLNILYNSGVILEGDVGEFISQNCPTSLFFFKLREKWFYIGYVVRIFQKNYHFSSKLQKMFKTSPHFKIVGLPGLPLYIFLFMLEIFTAMASQGNITFMLQSILLKDFHFQNFLFFFSKINKGGKFIINKVINLKSSPF